MDSIFHEKQEGYLCAQHCLNALLQGAYYNAVDLADLAHEMDEQERIRMAESGVDSEDYRHFLEQPSGNVDDSGYFSVQVISSALKVWNLELIPYNSSEATALLTQKDPSQAKAYICNYKGHWFTIRKIGFKWFNLNSMLSGPQLISDTYLAMFLAQLIQEGYSIFIVTGTLPPSPADEILSKAASSSLGAIPKQYHKVPGGRDRELDARKLKLSKPVTRNQIQAEKAGSVNDEDEDEDVQLHRALQLSLQDFNDEQEDGAVAGPSSREHIIPIQLEEDDEEAELQKALRLSLECVTTPPTPEQEEPFWPRLNLLNSRTPSSESSAKLNT